MHAALRAVDIALMEEAIGSATDRLGFTFPADTSLEIDVVVVWSGVPLGGLTGETLDDEPICLVAVEGIDALALTETIVHEALHAVDMQCASGDSLVDRLRSLPDGTHQLSGTRRSSLRRVTLSARSSIRPTLTSDTPAATTPRSGRNLNDSLRWESLPVESTHRCR